MNLRWSLEVAFQQLLSFGELRPYKKWIEMDEHPQDKQRLSTGAKELQPVDLCQ